MLYGIIAKVHNFKNGQKGAVLMKVKTAIHINNDISSGYI